MTEYDDACKSVLAQIRQRKTQESQWKKDGPELTQQKFEERFQDLLEKLYESDE